MSDTVIRVEGLGKKYIIGHQQERERYVALRDMIARGAKSLLRAINPLERKRRIVSPDREEFWALKDVSFEVKRGDRIGIIGQNGAGKSTLLKILSRITEPTTGRVQIRGRVASLLEVGTGFHPELTGRENIYLNGAILGMSRAEIRRKFDEIVAFAEVERFLDTPVKRYSSGMYVRLAFAVAAHLEPEILVVDEVLAVGDAAFQKKCLGKMEDVARSEGRTILFVSHNMSAIQTLCDYCIVLNAGRIIANRSTSQAIQVYLSNSSPFSSFDAANTDLKKKLKIVSAKIYNPYISPNSKSVEIEVQVIANEATIASLDVRLTDRSGVPVGFGSLGTFNPSHLLDFEIGLNLVYVSLETEKLANGSYFISLDLTQPNVEFYDRIENCLSFEVIRSCKNGAMRVLDQAWGYGSFELELTGKISKIR